MVRCNQCGHDNETTSRFCVHCGAQLAPQSAIPGQARPDPQRHAAQQAAGAAPEQFSPTGTAPGDVPAHQPSTPVGTPTGGPGGRSPGHAGYQNRPSTPGSPPPLIVPGSAGLDKRADDFQSAEPPAAQNAPPSRNLAFAETAPPLLDADLHRPIPDRGARQVEAGQDAGRATHNPPASVSPAAPPEQTALDPLSVPQDAPRVLAGFLVSYEGNALGQSWTVQQGMNLVGRLGAAAGADIELPHATVSSRHAVLFAAAHPGRLVLRDQGSTNGSFVNDTALQPDEQRELRDGDRVRFGLFTVIVKIV